MKYVRYNDVCATCKAPGPVVNVPDALPAHDRPGFIARFYGKVNWLLTPAGPLCPTCKDPSNVAT